jgi:hypothetical protein
LLAATAELFRSIGYDVVTAGDAAVAIDILKNRSGIDTIFQ